MDLEEIKRLYREHFLEVDKKIEDPIFNRKTNKNGGTYGI